MVSFLPRCEGMGTSIPPRLSPPSCKSLLAHPQINIASQTQKPKREKRSKQERQPRAHEEPRFNIGPTSTRRGQPVSPGGRSRTSRRPDVSDAGSIPDYPPPSFDEAVAAAAAARNAPPLSPADSTNTHSSSPDRYQPVPILIPPLPRTQNQPVVTRSLPDSELPESLRYSTQADYDSGSDDGDLEVISPSEATSPATPSEQESPRNPARGGTRPEFGTAPVSGRSARSSPSHLTLTPHLSDTSQDDDRSVWSPSTDSQASHGLVGPRNSTPSPVPPRRRLHLLSGLLKSRDNHPASVPSTPTYAGASQLSLPLNFLNHPGSPSKAHRGEGLISRKLFGHKGKDKTIDPEAEMPSEPLETWDMLSDVERDVPSLSTSSVPTPPASCVSEHPQGTPDPSDPAIRLLSPDPRRRSAPSKHRSLLNHRVAPSPLPLAQMDPLYPTTLSTDTEPREPPVPSQRQLMASTVAATPLAIPAPLVGVDNTPRGRALRHTSSMVWTPDKRNSPVPSPTRSMTTTMSPSTSGSHLQPSVAAVDVADTAATMATRDDQEGIFGPLPASPVQEEEDEQFVTPPGSPVRSLAALPLATISRHPSPVRHEGRPGVTLRDDGPVPPGSPTRSESHTRATRTLTITPRPSVGALHAFAPSNPSPLSNQSFERQAASPSTISPTIESMTSPKRDTVVSIGDTESLIELYVHSQGPTMTASSAPHTTAAASEPSQSTPVHGADFKHHHYPGRPLPHPPGASQSGPVQPVLLDLFLSGNVPAGLPPYKEVELEKGRSANALSSPSKRIPRAIWLPPSPPVNQPGGHMPATVPPPGLLAVLDDDASEPSSPGSTYEMPPSLPPAIQREFTSLEALETRGDDDGDATVTGRNRENLLLVPGMTSSVRVGPARTRTIAMATTSMTTHMTSAQNGVNGAQLGRIQMVRRRVTRSGRVKLKLVLLGATVDRCVMCKTQFRDNESAALGTRCEHAFHERCAGSWLSCGNRTCPECGTLFG
ncbi:hypothetical protein BC827DRAFT_422531 [Russula dissimulans]|nr:hypothetical protein BC827DRAFT_422531 [Russula dissimulans]